MNDTFIGKTLADKYRIDSLMRETELGKVYHATHLSMEKPLIVKILSPALAVDENIVKRFSSEARNISNISHPNILNVTDFGSDANGAVYIVYENATGETLESAIGQDGKFAPERAISIAEQIASALSAAHLKGIIHGNLNSENILLGADEAVKVLDLGTIKSDELPEKNIEYLSPEQCADAANADARSDIYSTGVILYEMLAGEVPFKADNAADLMMKHATEPPPPLSAFRQDLPPAIEPLILQTLSKNPEMRHQTAAELLDDLHRAALSSTAPNITKASNNLWKTAFVALAGIALLSAALIWATSSKQTNPATTLQTDANSQPVQPLNPPTGINEQGLATIVPISQEMLSNSNMTLTVPEGVGVGGATTGGSDGNPYWQNGRVPPGAPQYVPPGQVIDPNNPNSVFTRDEPTSGGNIVCDNNGKCFYIVAPTPNANTNAQPSPTPKTTKSPAANTSVQPSPAPNETPKPQTSPTPDAKPTPAKPQTSPSPKPTDKPKNAPSSTKTTTSGKTQDSR